MSVSLNRLKNRVAQAVYRPRKHASKSHDSLDPAKIKKTITSRLESIFLEEEKEEKSGEKDEK